MYYSGIDIGSRTSKIAVLKDNEIAFSKVVMTGLFPSQTALDLKISAIDALDIPPKFNLPLIATGYGRNQVKDKFKVISEISCHAKGVNFFIPNAEMVIDIGGQDSKGIFVDSAGRALDFVMNDRCAAGSGRFLEKVAEILEIGIDQLGDLANKAEKTAEVNSTCVVFAESEIIGMIAKGIPPAEIAAGVHLALARRIRNLIATLPDVENIVFTGGVALNTAMKNALEIVTNKKIMTPEFPELTGAVGAAIYAKNA